MVRWFWFIVAVLFGAALGMLYGWVINPVEFVDTTPSTLRVDYRSDYVLMVAEVYSAERDLEAAVRRLAILGDKPPDESVREVMIFAAQAPYADSDQALLSQLASDLQTRSPTLGAPAP